MSEKDVSYSKSFGNISKLIEKETVLDIQEGIQIELWFKNDVYSYLPFDLAKTLNVNDNLEDNFVYFIIT